MKKPITEKPLAANRANARKSTGPATARGKSISSQNAIKHGFLANTILLPGEAPERFLELKNTYLRQFQPQTQDEFDLVDTLAVNRWRLLRNWTFESVSLIHEQRLHAEANAGQDPPTQAMMALRSLQNPPRSQEALSRHEVRLDRQYYKALDRLLNLIRGRRTGDLVACRSEKEKSSKRTWEVLEKTNTPALAQPEERPKEPRKSPKENPTNPEEDPIAA